MTATFLMNITHGFQARMFLRTTICEELQRHGARIVVATPNADEPYFKQEMDALGVEVEQIPRFPTRAERVITGMRQYLLMNPKLGGTLNYKRERQKREMPVRYRLARAGNLVLGRSMRLRQAYLDAEARMFDGAEFDEMLQRIQPDLVIAGTPGVHPADAHILRAAKRADIPSATLMLSWDNLTSKGYMAANPDNLLVWSPLMAQEALTYHDYDGNIVEVGAAQFDHYPAFRRGTLDRRVAKEQLGVPPDMKLLTFGTINRGIYKEQLKDLSRLVDTLQTDEKYADCFLWVRLHPQSVVGAPEDELAWLQDLEARSDRIRVEFPEVRSAVLAWDLPKSDIDHLARLLGASDIVLVPRSTLTIDASCVDVPVINLAIDPEFKKGFNYTHYKNIVRSGGAWIANSHRELLWAIERYLLNPDLHSEGRARIVKQQLGTHLGRAGQQTAHALLQLCGVDVDVDTSVDTTQDAPATSRSA